MSAVPARAVGIGINLGLIGAGIRGVELMQVALGAGAKLSIVCDLYDGHLRRAREISPAVQTTRRFEEVLQNPGVEAVLVATSDHWHAPVAIAAMRAGKDVYCEKPMSHTIPEALEMVEVSCKTGRLLQVGSQSVSMTSTQKAKAWVDSGAIGKVYMAQCSIYRPNAIGAWRYPVPPDASPQTVDWQRFLGSAPKRPFDAQRFFRFRNWWDYGTGIAGDEYVHLLSRVHYVLGVQYPLSAVSDGGLYKWRGDREVPDIHNTLYDYGAFTAQVSANLVSNWEGGEIVRFMGDRGSSSCGRTARLCFLTRRWKTTNIRSRAGPKTSSGALSQNTKAIPQQNRNRRSPTTTSPGNLQADGRRHRYAYAQLFRMCEIAEAAGGKRRFWMQYGRCVPHGEYFLSREETGVLGSGEAGSGSGIEARVAGVGLSLFRHSSFNRPSPRIQN